MVPYLVSCDIPFCQLRHFCLVKKKKLFEQRFLNYLNCFYSFTVMFYNVWPTQIPVTGLLVVRKQGYHVDALKILKCC